MRRFVALALLCAAASASVAQAQRFTTNIEGRILDAETETPLPGATIRVQGTAFGAAAGPDGRFVIEDIPGGRYRLRISFVGYATAVVDVDVSRIELFEERPPLVVRLRPAEIEGEEVVVTATRTERSRREVPVIVNVIDDAVFASTQALSLSEGLSFQPGLRLEVDCQTCNYTQVRLNGMAGSYTQILIDSRPIFSALNGLYGLDQIPANMIERVEVVRGGGSALFGASAIAGTINIITREPVRNTSTVGFHQGLIDGATPDRALTVNTSVVDAEGSAGVFLFGILRDRSAYDHDGDTFSEIPMLRNNSFGLRAYYKPGDLSKLTLEAHSLTEERQGGNRIGETPHMADQGEYRLHHVVGGGLTYEQYLPARVNKVSAYVSGQHTARDHYTGIDHVDAYGDTENLTLLGGLQYSHTIDRFAGAGMNTITAGVEVQYDDVADHIPFYGHALEQTTRQAGLYLQSDWKLHERAVLLTGGRLDAHSLLRTPVFNPRLNMLVDLLPGLQWRGSYATGFRAPQAFDADLHIAFAGGGVSRIQIVDGLEKETSRSFSTSLDYNHTHRTFQYGLTLEAFHTRLFDTFVLEEAGTDAQGNLLLERRNGSHSTVAGVTAEVRYAYRDVAEVLAGLTVQRSRYDTPVVWSAELPGTRRYLRTPDVYGFFALSASPWQPFTVSLSGVLTGPMDVPHLAGYVERDTLMRSPVFLETNLRTGYTFANGALPDVEVFAGVQNVFDQYQRDFDRGKYRDSNYVYGPARPRTFFFGLKATL